MDFLVCLTWPGAQVARQKVGQLRVGFSHNIKRENIIQWFLDKVESVMPPKVS